MFTRFAAVLAALLCNAAVFAQAVPVDDTIRLDVTVKSNAVPPALQQGDFTILDNKNPQAISAFRGVSEKQAPIQVMLVVDELNAPYAAIASTLHQLGVFLRANGGKLQYPTSIGILTASGLHAQEVFSKDGNALGKALDDSGMTSHSISRGDEINALMERFQISLTGLRTSAGHLTEVPGRKILIWISPGWPLIANIQLEPKNHQAFYEAILRTNAELQKARVTVYCINPYGSSISVADTFAYEGHLKAVTKPGQAEIPNLSLPVLVLHSGGEFLTGSNDVGGSIQKIFDNLETHYELSYARPPGEHPDEYHHIEVKIAKPGLTAQTVDGYYAPRP